MNEPTTTELVRTGRGDVIQREPPDQNPYALMARAIELGKCDVAVIERLADLQDRFDRKNAKREFDTALAAFQSECPVILKTVNGAQNNYRYAPLDHIVTQVRPLLEKHGFAYALTGEVEEGWVKAIIRVTHRAGHSESSEFKVPIDKRNGLMSDPQRYGGSMTYSKRLCFCNAFGILTADEDRDGQTASVKRGLKSRLAEQRGMDSSTESPAGSKPAGQPAPQPPKGDDGITTDALKGKLWKILEPVRGNAKPTTWVQAETWMRGKKILALNQSVRNATQDDLKTMIEMSEIALEQ